MSNEMNYASAVVSMLDRDSQTTRQAMMYPITRVELKHINGDAIVTSRVFVVDDSGHWVEAS